DACLVVRLAGGDVHLDVTVGRVVRLDEHEIWEAVVIPVRHAPGAVVLVRERRGHFEDACLVVRLAGGDVHLDVTVGRVVRLDENQVGDAVTVPVCHEPSAIVLVREGGGNLKDACLVVRLAGGDVHLDVTVGRVVRLDENQVGDAVTVPVCHEPSAIVLVREGGGNLKDACLVVRLAGGDVHLDVTVGRVVRLDENQVGDAVTVPVCHEPSAIVLVRERRGHFEDACLVVRLAGGDVHLDVTVGRVVRLDEN